MLRPETPAAKFRFVEQNVQGTDPRHQIIASIRNARDRADVLCLNEMSNRGLIKEALGDDWAFTTRGEETVAWRDALFEGAGLVYRKVHGAQKHITPVRQIVTAVLKHKASGLEVAVQCTHAVHHIDSGGRPMRYRGGERVRFRFQAARARMHFKKLATAVVNDQRKYGRVIGGGDLNVDYKADKRVRYPTFPFHLLTARAKAHVYTPGKGTEGKRMIDWTWSKGKVKVSDTHVIPRSYADHLGVASTVELLP